MKAKFSQFLIIGLLGVVLAACSSKSEPEATEATPFPYTRLSPSSPPPSPYEEKPEPSEPMRQVWRKGYWDYDGLQFFWVPGEYMYRPDPTAAWTPDRWERRTFGWAFVPGYWQ